MHRALLIGQVIFYSLFGAVWFVGNLVALHFLADARVTMVMCWGMLCYILAWIAGGLGRLAWIKLLISLHRRRRDAI